MTTPEGFPAACDVSAWSHADLMSGYVEITAQLRDGEHHRRGLCVLRAELRDAIIDRVGLKCAMRFMAEVEKVLRL